ncbi:hypothetical protein [Nostocoides sp. HKS02]|uniref:hypothetical protein n=1 Tax=Nostocoides sp. HKS02 TaxID=1813880 RepID=UPI0012B4E2C7|nr:hypothetical protein [Tetrasphaera sp. HKS02]QGN59155.1 hypothetical protein GKE56_16080 [Tetrasphaera sp. HKS02]
MAAVAVGVLAVSGCATAGTAAVVNGDRITEQQLLTAVSQLNAAAPGAHLDNATALTLLLRAPFTRTVADGAGKGLSDSAVKAALRTDKLNTAAIDIVRTSDAFNPQNPAVLSQAEQMQVLQALQKADITLNPRYGKLDRQNFSVGAATPNWIKAIPAPAAQG